MEFFKELQQLFLVLLVLDVLLTFRCLASVSISTFTWTRKTHKVPSLHQLAVFINDSNSDDIIVGIDLVHDSSHDADTFAIFDNLVVCLPSRTLCLLWFMLEAISLPLLLRCERTCHQQSIIDVLALSNNKCLSLLAYFFSQLCNQFSIQQLVN